MLVIDVTTYWEHRSANPVGIVRCELELIRNVLEKSHPISLVRYDREFKTLIGINSFYLGESGSVECSDNDENETIVEWEEVTFLMVAGVFWGDKSDSIFEQQQEHFFNIGVVLYDLIPIIHPELCEQGAALSFASSLHGLLYANSAFFCISENTENDLLEHIETSGYPVKFMENCKRVSLGPANITSQNISLKAPRCEYNLPVGGFALMVSSIEARKNHAHVFYLWRRLVEKHGDKTIPLVVVGSVWWGVSDILERLSKDPLLNNGKVIVLSSVCDEELKWLYSMCKFTLFPSYYEGFGMTVSESLWFEKPCICSTGSSLEEASQGYARHIDLLDGESWFNVAEELMFDDGKYKAEVSALDGFSRDYGWADFAEPIANHLLSFRGEEL